MLLFFFFFNDTATTEIYTLSLHDALPISDAKNAGEAKVGDTDTIKITGGVDVNKLLDDVNTALDKARSLGVEGSDQLDRKSTRLNSSHANISYAVFCLKKKKNIQ